MSNILIGDNITYRYFKILIKIHQIEGFIRNPSISNVDMKYLLHAISHIDNITSDKWERIKLLATQLKNYDK